jgi:orotate phosphoribosyltransferase
MRKLVLALAAVAAAGIALPTVVATQADAREVVIIKKKHRDHGRHYGWYRGNHYGWAKHHRGHGTRVIVR